MATKAQFDALADAINADLNAISPSLSQSVTFNLPSGYAVTIDSTGISSIKVGGVQVAYNGVSIYDANFWLPNPPPTWQPAIVSKSLSQVTANSAVVTHVFSGSIHGRAIFTYTIIGDDISIKVKISNDDTITRAITAISLPAIIYDSLTPFEQLPGHINSPYPSFTHYYGAEYLVTTSSGKPVNMAVWPVQDPYEKWTTGNLGIWPNAIAITNFFYRPLGPGAQDTFEFVLRLSSSTDWHTLLSGYKTHIRSRIPALLYTPDARPVGSFSSIDASYVRPDNPYGYNDSGGTFLGRRFDLSAQPFIDWVTPNLIAGKFQGLIMWQLQGVNPSSPTSPFYRPDFYVFPPQVLANLPTLVSGFKNHNLKIGLLARPEGIITLSGNWGIHRIQTIGADPDFIADLLDRFRWAINDMGFNIWYFDTFPYNHGNHLVLKAVRESVGPSVPIYVEHWNVAAAASAGFYSQIGYNINYDAGGNITLPLNLQILRYIWPETMLIGKVDAAAPLGVIESMFVNKISPLIEDWQIASNVAGVVPKLAALVPQYIDSGNQWL